MIIGYVCIEKDILKGSVLFMVSRVHWGSWNIIPQTRRGCCINDSHADGSEKTTLYIFCKIYIMQKQRDALKN